MCGECAPVEGMFLERRCCSLGVWSRAEAEEDRREGEEEELTKRDHTESPAPADCRSGELDPTMSSD
jgi:hypothetical protein